MLPRKTTSTLVLLVVAVALAVSPALSAKRKKAGNGIPDRPEQLTYGPLKFSVPDGDKYRHELKNGIPVYIAEDHDLPLVNLALSLRVGRFLEPAEKIGLASMTATMLRQGGTRSMTAEEFDEKADFLAVQLSAATGDTSGGASLNCITQAFDESLDLFFEMIQAPRFQQDRLDVEKANALENMKQRNDNAARIAGREWEWLMRGREFFGSRLSTEATINSISRDDLIEFHKKYWRPEHMIIAISGDVDTQQVLDKLNARFEGWAPEGPDVAWPPKGPDHTPEPGVYYVEKDIPQGRVFIGHLGTQRTSWEDPEPFALSVMNDILGGPGFTSRLMKRIRSDEGLAYGAYSSFGVDEWWPGEFRVRYESKSATVAYAAQIAINQIKSLRDQPVSDEELSTAKAQFIEVFPRRFESPRQIVGTFANDEYLGRPHGYWQSYRDKVGRVTAEDVQNAARKHLHPDKLVMLVVGKWGDIEPGDPDGKASMQQFGAATEIKLVDPLTLKPME